MARSTASASAALPNRRLPLDFGNSGTGCRLTLGAVAGCPITATFDGDASLRSRPMRRVLDPLERIGARTLASADGRLPLTLAGARDPMPIVFEPPVPSAQLKSATLLAGLSAPGETVVIEAEATRDHTEKMLDSFRRRGAGRSRRDNGRRITLTGQPELTPRPIVGARRSVVGGVSAGRRAPGAGLGRRSSTAS